MKRLTLAVMSGMFLLFAFVAGVYSQADDATDRLLARFQPLLVDIQQQVPVSVTLTVPLNDTEIQTVTVPMELNLNLQLTLSSTMTPVVNVAAAMPVIDVRPIASDDWHIDDLGKRYGLIIEEPDRIALIEWTAYTNRNAWFTIAGEVENISEERWQAVDFILRFYDENENLISVDTGSAAGRFVDPGQTRRFEINPILVPDDFDNYNVEVKVRE